MSSTYRRIARAFSTISSRRRTGLSEGKDSIPIDFCLQTASSDRLFNHVYSATGNSRQATFDLIHAAEIVEPASGKVLSYANRHIDIGIGATLIPCYRPEHRHTQHSGGAKFLFM